MTKDQISREQQQARGFGPSTSACGGTGAVIVEETDAISMSLLSKRRFRFLFNELSTVSCWLACIQREALWTPGMYL